MIQIKQVTPDLAPLVHALSQSMLAGEGWSLQQYIDETSRDNLFLCVLQGDTLAAFLQCDVVCDTANLNLIAVDAAFQRQGIARQLIQTACQILQDYLRREKFDSLTLSLEVRSQNTAAQKLYRSCGFCGVGTRKNFYSDPHDDAVIYIKEL